MENTTARISILCNAPKGMRGELKFIFGINDEKIGEGKADEIVELEVPAGVQDLLVMVTNGPMNCISDTTRIEAADGRKFKIKYSLFTKRAMLALRD